MSDSTEPEDGGEDQQDHAIIFLNGDIGPTHLQICGSLLNYHYTEHFDQPIQLIINSDGGDVSIGWSIIEVMDFIRLPVYTVALGVVASMAADIFVNGDKRIAGARSTLMIHPHNALRVGSHSQLIAHAKSDDIEHHRRLAHYANNSKYSTVNAVEKNLFTTRGDDLWLTPEEALAHGLCDEIASVDKSKRRKAFGFLPDGDGRIVQYPEKPKRRRRRST